MDDILFAPPFRDSGFRSPHANTNTRCFIPLASLRAVSSFRFWPQSTRATHRGRRAPRAQREVTQRGVGHKEATRLVCELQAEPVQDRGPARDAGKLEMERHRRKTILDLVSFKGIPRFIPSFTEHQQEDLIMSHTLS